MADEPFDNPHHGHPDEGSPSRMPAEVILYPHEWGGADWGNGASGGMAYLGPIHPDDKEGFRYVPAAAADALEAAVEIVIDEAGSTSVERVRRALIAAVNAYHDATRKPLP